VTRSLEHLQVMLVVLLFIDPLVVADPNIPRITFQLWRGTPRSPASGRREARMVWETDWTHTATPLYFLLSDLFAGQVPAVYGNRDRVYLDTVAWRQAIIDKW
jgi:hypothetical protein